MRERAVRERAVRESSECVQGERAVSASRERECREIDQGGRTARERRETASDYMYVDMLWYSKLFLQFKSVSHINSSRRVNLGINNTTRIINIDLNFWLLSACPCCMMSVNTVPICSSASYFHHRIAVLLLLHKIARMCNSFLYIMISNLITFSVDDNNYIIAITFSV